MDNEANAPGKGLTRCAKCYNLAALVKPEEEKYTTYESADNKKVSFVQEFNDDPCSRSNSYDKSRASCSGKC